ncbi:hypothetical protein [Stakelama tenebrarum]|nr:hypothetical protein [Sphingosinithalassobacter tenebrarum]
MDDAVLDLLIDLMAELETVEDSLRVMRERAAALSTKLASR